MKKIVFLLVAAFSLSMVAQDQVTEGVIITKTTMSSDNEQAQAQFDMMGEMLTTTYFKDKNSRGELNSPMSGNVITINNDGESKMLVLMDNPMMGKKYMLTDTTEAKELAKDVVVTEGEEVKTVLGYECKQYIVKMSQNGSDVEMVMFTTEAIPVASQQTSGLGDKLKGFPLHMTMKVNQMGTDMVIISEVTEIKKETVSEDKFKVDVPEGYEKMEGQ
ncbi:DUF4412 domain-containing protein [Olleya sp. HaHaR_3_96]|uniref:DUF4412 domain-containing protein n=1 Tax=Olleya sp. HaHaR_3_96 TaxID=2745560 RepID=UPI001C4EE65F|nr:DUF4412 domain-containing protein [Olleya sp. HaHaR_3_96]QXP59808.1 DUF4412 domain-containing protein [Olleya sp. HaHaR_3_96]